MHDEDDKLSRFHLQVVPQPVGTSGDDETRI
jgi:hypothetical protein